MGLFVRCARKIPKSNRARRRFQHPFVETLETRNLPSQLTWNPSASLTTPRGGVVAEPQAGEIAVIGGGLLDTPAVSVTNPIWEATVSSLALQDSPTTSPGAGLLADGSVLVFGGVDGDSATAVATKYDYTGNNTHTVAGMHTARVQLGFATDSNHLVYAIGGVNDSGTPLKTVESYDASSGDWTSAGSLPQTLYAEAAVSDGAGHIFTFGGVGADGNITSNVYEYTIASGTWSTVATTMPVAVRDSAAVLASNGRIYVLGGKTAAGTTADVESYDPVGNTWTTEAPLPAPLSDEAALGDSLGRIEILGGYDVTGAATANVWVSQELNQPDAAPVITTSPATSLKAGYLFSYQVLSMANPQASYQLTSAPTGMTINGATGLITWTPGVSQLGTFSFTVEAMNAAGNSSQTATVNVYQAPPTAPTGLTQTGETVSTATLSWTASFDPLGIDHYVVYSDVPHGHSGRGGGITYVYTAVATSTTTSATVTGLYSNFSGWFVVDAFNTKGVDSGHSYVYTLHTLPDTVPPTVSVPADVTVTTNTPSGTQVPSAFTATGSDPGPGLDSITISYAVNLNSITSSYLFPLGPTTVTAYAHDLYGNYTTGTFTVTVLNAVGPTLLLPANQVAEATNPGGAEVPAAFTATAPDYSTPNPTITYTVGTTTIDPSYDFPLGVTTVNVTATDSSGASASGSFTVTVKDTTPPTLTVPANPTVEATSSAGAPAPGAFTATATDAVTVNPTITYSNGVTLINPTYIFPFGTTIVYVGATDAAGNSTGKTFTVTVEDTTPPTLAVPPNQTVPPTSAAGAQDPTAFTATATDVASAYPPIITYTAGPFTLDPGYTFPLGITTVLVKATDSSGNTSSGSFTVTVPPGPGLTLLTPGNQTVQASSGSGASDAAAFTASTYDPGNTPTITYSVGGTPIAGITVFPVGTTTVLVKASDQAGNSKTGTFTVTVLPPPVVTPTPLSWTAGIGLPVGIASAVAYPLSTGIWLFGGNSTSGTGTSVYNLAPGASAWAAGPALNRPYIGAAVGETYNVGPLATDGDTTYKYATDLFIYGGNNGTQASSGMVNYNPYPAGLFPNATIAGPSMSTGRSALAYAADPLTGDLYAIGGLGSTGSALASAEVYNPNTDAWTALAPLPQAIYGAVGLTDGAGHIFVFGGDNSAGTPVATAYRYTIATNTWDSVASLPVATSYAASVRGPDGNVYLLGGKTSSGAVANVLMYNLTTNTWSTATPLPDPVYGAAAVVDANEDIEVIGGYNAAGQLQNTVLVSQNVPVPPPHLAILTPVPASVSFSSPPYVTVALEDAGGNIEVGNSSDVLGVTVAGPDAVTPVTSSSVQLYSGTASYGFFSATNPGIYSMTFSDGSAQGVSIIFGLGVSQAIPSVTVNNSTFTYDGTAHSASAGAVGSGGAAVSGTFSFTFNGSPVAPTDAGTYAVVAAFTSSDPNYSNAVATGTLTINPTSPIVTLQAGTIAFDGTAHAATATAVGVDGITPVDGSLQITYNGSSTPPTAPGTYAVVATFISSDPTNDYTNLTATDTLTIVPAQLVLTAPASVVPGTPFDLTVSAQDSSGHTVSGFGGIVSLTSTAGTDISPDTVLVLNGTLTIPVTLTAAGDQTITASFPGLPSATATILVTAGPPSPFQITLPSGTSVQAGRCFLIALQAMDGHGNPVTSYNGPPTVTISVNPASAASNLPATVPISSTGLGLFLVDLQQAGSYTLSVTSGSSIAGVGPLIVLPGPAARLAFGTQPVNTPTGLALPPVSVQILDTFGNVVTSDNTDTMTLAVASGPGSFTAGSIPTATAVHGVATFSNLTLVKPGRYQLSAVDSGRFTGPASAAFTVQPLQVLPGSVVGTPTSFSLQFNAPFLVNSTTPALYGHGFGSTGIIPAVTLTQTLDASGNPVNNPIEGSVILNPATNSFTFLATNTAYEAATGSPLLPDGTYTVSVAGSSAANGFQALNAGGGFLDGLGTGVAGSGNFTTTFTVGAAGSDVVWVPATANGPGQALSAPGKNQAGVGYPIYLNDSTGTVTSVQVTLDYNPSLLTVTGTSGTGFTLLSSSTPGQAVLQYNGAALPTGSGEAIGYLLATVPSGTAANPIPYKAKDVLHLSNVSLNGGSIAVATSDGLHLVAYVGDVDGNGSYTSNDAVLVTRVSLQTDSGFAAYPLVDPVIVADTDGAGYVPADAALQINEAGVGFPTANLASPPIPPGVQFQVSTQVMHASLRLATGTPASAPSTGSAGGSAIAATTGPALMAAAPPQTPYVPAPINPVALDAFFSLQADDLELFQVPGHRGRKP